MKELREERIKKDEEKLLNAIHQQHKDALMEYRIDRELEEITEKENLRKEKRANCLKTIALIIAIIAIVFLGIKYNEKEVSKCIENGKSESFCRYAGE